MDPTSLYGARAELPPPQKKADFAMKQTNICRRLNYYNLIIIATVILLLLSMKRSRSDCMTGKMLLEKCRQAEVLCTVAAEWDR